MKNKHGLTLIELMIVLAIFSVVMAGLYASYVVQTREGVKQYRLAESEMELQIAKSIMERDLAMAGYGLAEDYSAFSGLTAPRPASGSDGDPNSDELILRGTAIGLKSRAAQGWTYLAEVTGGTPSFRIWSDVRENLTATVGTNDIIILLDPNTRKLIGSGTEYLFKYNGRDAQPTRVDNGSLLGLTNADMGLHVYGLYSGETSTTKPQPYYAVRYYRGGTAPAACAPDTTNLLRAESRGHPDASNVSGDPILNCVLDFQMAFGLDTNDDGVIDCWDNGGTTNAAGYTIPDLNKRLKQIRVYVLVQEGSVDQNYLYKNPDPLYTSKQDKIWVGDLGINKCIAGGVGVGGVGREIQLTPQQRKYRWRVLSLALFPRNMR